MQKLSGYKKGRDSEKAVRVKRTAITAGVSQSLVYKVIKGERVHDEVMRIYMQLEEGENLLLQAVKQAAPFE